MKTQKLLVLGTAGALAVGGVVLPAAGAQNRPGDRPGVGQCDQSSPRAQRQQGPGNGPMTPAAKRTMKHRARSGSTQLPSGTLTEAQEATLASMAEEEKLAHDVYIELAQDYPRDRVFANIAQAESNHLAAVQRMLVKYDVPDPTKGMAAGEFASPAMSSLYRDLLDAATSRSAAFEVGVTIEKLDIADLKRAQEGLTAPDVSFVYSRLLAGSQRHLAAFSR